MKKNYLILGLLVISLFSGCLEQKSEETGIKKFKVMEDITQYEEGLVVVSKSWYVLESSMYYDWVEDGKLDKKYFRIPLSEIKEFEEKNNNNCIVKRVGGYPLAFLCKTDEPIILNNETILEVENAENLEDTQESEA